MTIKHLVIPGGGPLGIQALGALQNLEKAGFWNINDIQTIYATSAGAILSLLLALKFDWDSINDYIVLRPWHETYNVNITQIFEAYKKKGIFDKTIVEIFYKPFFETRDLPLTMTMREFYEYSGIELHFFSLELNSFEIIDINHKTFSDIPVIQSVHMSCAIPMIIAPVCFDNKCFVDGGVISNYPIKYCMDNEKNLDEIFGIQNIYEKKENNIVNDESTMLDYVVHFISRLVKNANSRTVYTDKIPYELKYDASLMSLDNMKETLYSSDARKHLLEKGLKAAEDFLSKLEITNQENGIEQTDFEDN
jgi:predicted acylesterase/phospholipase RssA